MKKSLLAVVAALAMAGCSQNDLVDEIDNGGQISKAEIRFNSIVGKGSRATALTAADFKSFQVYAYKSADAFGPSTSLAPEYLKDEIKKTDNTWAGGKTVYWPMTDKVNFFAYAPTSITGFAASTGYPTIAYTVPAVDSQVDLVVANALNKVKADNTVELAFKHALTQVNFSVKLMNKDTKYIVTSITLSGIANKSTFTYNEATATICGAWSTPEGSDSYAYDFAANGITTTGVTPTTDAEITDLSTASNSLMLLPQTFSGTAKISVIYSAEIGGEITYSGTKEITLDGAWGVGQKVRYTLELTNDAKAVGFTTTFDEWGKEDSGAV